MNRFAKLRWLGWVGAAALVSGVASAAMTDAGGGSAVFDAVGPAGLKIEGKTNRVTVAEQAGAITITVAIDSLDTGIDLRNKHMREKYMETGKYPNAVLTVARASIQLPADGADSTGSASGMLSLHGQIRPLAVSYKVHRSGDTYAASGTGRVHMGDFGIAPPSFLGITVKPDVDIAVSFHTKDQ